MDLLNEISICNFSTDLIGAKVALRLSQLGAKVVTDYHAADVIVYNFNAPVWGDKVGGEEQFRGEHPDVTLAEYSTYGSHTIWREREGSESEAQALSGITMLTGDRDDRPIITELEIGMEFCATYLVHGILAALYRGRGCKVSTSVMEALLSIQTEMITTSQYNDGRIPVRAAQGNAHAYLSAPYGIYRTKDGYFAMSITPVPRLAEVMEIPITEEMKPRKGWFDYRDEIMALIAERFLTKTNQEWLDIFEPLDIWCGVVLSRSEILKHEGYLQLKSSELPYRILSDGTPCSRTVKRADTKPLHGVVVVDFSQFLSAPSATLQLADLGATVIKVERREVGESGRDIIFDYTYMDDDESSEFLAINRNKLSYAADLKDSVDMAGVMELVKRADLLVHNFRPEVIKRLKLDYQAVKSLNPKVVYASISGYGDKGCWVAKPGQDLIVQALSGLTTLNGSKPRAVGAAIVDLIAGAHLVEGVLAALNSPKRGAEISITMLGSIMDMQSGETTQYSGEFWNWNDLFSSPYGESLRMLQSVKRASGYTYTTTRCPVRIDDQLLTCAKGAPVVGEDTLRLKCDQE